MPRTSPLTSTRKTLIDFAFLAAAVAAVTMAVTVNGQPRWVTLVVFSLPAVASANTALRPWDADADVSLVLFLAMAALGFLGADGNEGAIATTIAISLCDALTWDTFRRRRWHAVAINIGATTLSAGGAASTYLLLLQLDVLQVIAMGASVVAYASINICTLLFSVYLDREIPVKVLWSDIRPTIPNYFATGIIGLLVGVLAVTIGPAVIVFSIILFAISRWTFTTFLRLRSTQGAVLRVFVRLIEAKDAYTAGHTERVAVFARCIGEELGLPPERIDRLHRAALMHDVGKLAVPSRLLNKPGRLTPEEWDVMKRHNTVGVGILGRIDFLRETAVTASDKHGHYNAPGHDTPPDLVFEAHIVAVADAFDAMTSTRSYRQALDQSVAFAELRKHSGTQFNPECAEALIAAIERRGERYGAGHETDIHEFAVPPPIVGVGSAGLGDLASGATAGVSSTSDGEA